jgi:NAD(P)-dependent dehydrogenase (short-subunit alcohol dehydrogenase family)
MIPMAAHREGIRRQSCSNHRRWVRRGCQLSLSDVDEAGLAETVLRCERSAVKVMPTALDVADRDALFAWADQAAADRGKVNIIANNAGVALVAMAAGQSLEDFEWLMNINFWGVVHRTQPHQVGRYLRSSPSDDRRSARNQPVSVAREETTSPVAQAIVEAISHGPIAAETPSRRTDRLAPSGMTSIAATAITTAISPKAIFM